jgi:hypothetical protein
MSTLQSRFVYDVLFSPVLLSFASFNSFFVHSHRSPRRFTHPYFHLSLNAQLHVPQPPSQPRHALRLGHRPVHVWPRATLTFPLSRRVLYLLRVSQFPVHI